MSLFKIFFKITLLFVLISFSLFEDLLSQPSQNEDQRNFIHLSNEYYVSDQSYYFPDREGNRYRVSKIGTIAKKYEICNLFKHPIFSQKNKPETYNYDYYYYVPIDDIKKSFLQILPDFKRVFLGGSYEDAKRWYKRYEDDFSMSSSCLPTNLLDGSNTNILSVRWTEIDSLHNSYSKMKYGIESQNSRGLRLNDFEDFNILAVLYLREMHPALIKRFDEILVIQNKKAEIRKEENRVIAEKERIALMEKELEIKAEENRKLIIEQEMKRTIFWDKVKTFFYSLFFIGIALVLVIRSYRIKAERARNLLEEERKEKARKSELERERENKIKAEAERQLRKGRTTRWMKKGRKIQREINSVKKSIETINKQDVTNNKQIERLESEKKLIEDNIDQLNKDIKGEKKVVSKLRKKYPFIDDYIANR